MVRAGSSVVGRQREQRTAHQEIREDCLTGSYLLNLNSQDVVSEFDSQGLQYHFQSAMFGGIAEGAVGLRMSSSRTCQRGGPETCGQAVGRRFSLCEPARTAAWVRRGLDWTSPTGLSHPSDGDPNCHDLQSRKLTDKTN